MKKILSIITCIILVLTISFAFSSCKNSGNDQNSETNQGGGNTDSTDHSHSYTPAVTQEATCTADGVKTYSCSCGDSYTQPITAKGHNFVEGVCSCGEKENKEEDEVPPAPVSYTIYFRNAEGWENVSVYIWHTVGETDNLYSGAWPGAAMTQVEETVWYSYTVDLTETEGVQLVFNNGLAEGASQTKDLNFNAENLWWADETAFATQSEAEAAQLEEVTVYYKNTNNWETPYISAWNASGTIIEWPGVAMTQVGDSDWYSATIETLSLDGFGYVFNDGTEDGQKSADVVYNDEKPYYANGYSYASQAEADEAKLESYTIYFKNSDGWDNVSVYIWLTENKGTEDAIVTNFTGYWPGAAMTKVDGSDEWYSFTIDFAETEGIELIFNNGDTENCLQTSDLSFSAEKLWWANNMAFETQAEAEASQTVEYSDWYLRGDNNSWGTGNRLLLDSNGNSYITIELAAGVEFKFADAGWSKEITYSDSVFQANENFDWGASNHNIKVVNAGTYTFTISADGTVTIVKT